MRKRLLLFFGLGVAVPLVLAAIFPNTFTSQSNPGFLISGTNASFPGTFRADGAVFTNQVKVLNEVLYVVSPAELRVDGGAGTGKLLQSDAAGVAAWVDKTNFNAVNLTNYFRTLFHTISGTNIDANLSSFQGVTLAASTAFHLSNSTNGTRLLVRFLQNGTGGFTPTIDNVNWVATPSNWNTNAGGISYVTISDVGGGTADAMLVGTNAAASASTTVSVNGTNVTSPNFTNTATVSYAISGSDVLATASSTSTPPDTTPFLLSYSGSTNVTGDYSKEVWYVTVTNTTFFATPANFPSSATASNHQYTVFCKMDGTGGWAVTYTNTYFKFGGGVVPIVDTNANAVSVLTFTTSPFTAGELIGGIGVLKAQ